MSAVSATGRASERVDEQMIGTALSWTLVGGAFILAWVGIRAFLRFRSIELQVAENASATFHSAVASALKTPGELPDEILRMIEFLANGLENRSTPRDFWYALKQSRGTADYSKQQNGTKIDTLRPELQDLLNEAIVTSVAYLQSSSLVYGLLIRVELDRMRGKTRKFQGVDLASAIKALPRVQAHDGGDPPCGANNGIAA